ncbi:hypothetical protein SUGI_0877940 [Cryptomeria japonica]|uniref:uncharacterized protein LOC131032382 n=1 Tax=Cryptomeria japonica TaxID=3369 RepID=UPI002414C14F|nr:uncharacterized protein LOC131032382 [Cryptomeria japonica]GLJ42389.1 hypothetical protein SUGI_0877940 [Cryptomeria japonica]
MEDHKENLFAGLPPPSSLAEAPQPSAKQNAANFKTEVKPLVPPKPTEVPKGALKRPDKRSATQVEDNKEVGDKEASKRVRFKMTVDASTKQVLDAMQKISTHIGNPAKFSKASKLALQLVQAGSVNAETCDRFFEVLQAAMASPSSCTNPGLRADYHALFSAAQDIVNCFNKQQQQQLETWIIRAQVANDLFTDDSFIFSKASARVRQAISSLPEASTEDDILEEMLLSSREDENGCVGKPKDIPDEGLQESEAYPIKQVPSTTDELETDPFGLDALLQKPSKKDEKARKKKDEAASNKKALDDAGKILREHREALMQCLEIGAGRYRVPWAQTMIDILVKHAYDSISRFTARQRDIIEKLWASIRDQQMRRRQGKSATGKLDVTAFERLQERYANEKISIRHGVGDGGERRAQQWLG